MTTVTIPRELAKKGDLVLVPRKEYEELLQLKPLRRIGEVPLDPAQRRAIMKARKALLQGKYLTLHELKRKLGIED